MSWRTKLSLWPEVALTAAIAACAVGLYLSPSHVPRILLLDQPREQIDRTDYVLEFLEVTQTPYTLHEGFIELEGTRDVERRLLQLLAGLTTALEVSERNETHGDRQGERMRCFPTPDGGVQVVADRTTGNRFKSPNVVDIRRQYDVVLAAIREIRPGAVGLPPGEQTFRAVPRTVSFESSVQPAAWIPRDAAGVIGDPPPHYGTREEDDIVELLEVVDEPPSNGGRNN